MENSQKEADFKKREADQKILDNISQQMGKVANPLKIMAKRPGMVQSFMAYRNQIFEDGPLTKKEQSLIALATAIAIQSATCIRTHADNARKAGAQEDEIVQVMLIVGLMAGVPSLHLAFGALSKE